MGKLAAWMNALDDTNDEAKNNRTHLNNLKAIQHTKTTDSLELARLARSSAPEPTLLPVDLPDIDVHGAAPGRAIGRRRRIRVVVERRQRGRRGR